MAPSAAAARDDVPGALDRLVLGCLIKDPEQRIQTAAEVLERLQAPG